MPSTSSARVTSGAPVARGAAVHDLCLPDGRILTFADLGHPDGTCVVACHGTPGSRVGWLPLDDAARQAGVRLIVPDRPGMGGSALDPRRTVGSWTGDVAALLDHLGVQAAQVLGHSGGGPFALACGTGRGPLAGRVPRVVLVSGCAPVERLVSLLETGPLDLWLGLTARLAPRAADLSLAILGLVVQGVPALAGPEVAADLAEAMRAGPRGVREDYRLISGEWDFMPEEVTVPVLAWHGTDDDIVSLHEAQDLYVRLPTAELRVVPGAGHLLVRSHAAQILADLATCICRS